jgi:hypothetical protein
MEDIMKRVSYRQFGLGRSLLAVLFLLGLLFAAAPLRSLAWGESFDGTPGTDAPPATLGPYTMLPFALDTRELQSDVTTIPGPTGDLTLSSSASHRQIGSGWATWSHSYAGDVYYVEGDEITITLPPNTMAFYLYVESDSFSENMFTMTSGGVSSGSVAVQGNAGATYFGFYSVGDPLPSVTVHMDSGSSFAFGEFGIASGAAASMTSPRADVAAVIYGGWGGMPVQAWVGGTAQPTLYTAPNQEGHAAVLFTFWPPEGAAWKVGVSPALPAGLDPARWEIKLVGMTTGGRWVASPTAGDVTVTQGSQIVLYYQLVDKG